MRMNHRQIWWPVRAGSALLLLSVLDSQLSTVRAQGAPAPTMKTLGQIQPRTPVDAAHTSIDITNDQVNAWTSFPR